MMDFPDDADGKTLRKVAEHGDMSMPMNIDFMVDVPSQAMGKEVARSASEQGYKTSLEYDDETQRWTCYCTKLMVPTYGAIIAAQKELDDLSEAMLKNKLVSWGFMRDVRVRFFGNTRQFDQRTSAEGRGEYNGEAGPQLAHSPGPRRGWTCPYVQRTHSKQHRWSACSKERQRLTQAPKKHA